MNELGKKVKEIRLSRKMTQQEFAESLGYTHKSAIAKIEKGEREMAYDKMLLMFKLYNFNLKDINLLTTKDIAAIGRPESSKIVIYICVANEPCPSSKFIADQFRNYSVKTIKYQTPNIFIEGLDIKKKFVKVTRDYDEVILVAHSFGAIYAIENLYSYNIKHAFFISPIIDMYQYYFDIMNKIHITEKKLKTSKIISLENGLQISYDFYRHSMIDIDKWDVPTKVIYGYKDRLVFINTITNFIADHNAKLVINRTAGHPFNEPSDKTFLTNELKEKF